MNETAKFNIAIT